MKASRRGFSKGGYAKVDDWEGKIKELLSNPEELAKIAALASSVIKNQNGPPKESGPQEAVQAFAADGGARSDRPISPELLNSIFSALPGKEGSGSINSQKINLISAVEPFLSDDYRHQVERGIRMVRTADMLSGLFKSLSRGD